LKGTPRKPSEKKKRKSKRVAPLGSDQTSLATANCWEAQMRDFNDLGYGNDIDPPERAMISAQKASSGVKSDMGTEANVTAHNPKLDVSRILAALDHDGEIDEIALRKDLQRVRLWFKNKDELQPPKGVIDGRIVRAKKLSKAASHLLHLTGDDQPIGIRNAIARAFPIDPGDRSYVGSYVGERNPLPPDLLREVPTWEALKAGLHYLKQVADAETARQGKLREKEIAPWLIKNWLIGTRLVSIFERHFKIKAGYTKKINPDDDGNPPADGPFIRFVRAVYIAFGYPPPHPDTIGKAISAGRKLKKNKSH
jgi:hypothetical protein